MLGHRALNLDDYLFILKRRLWIIAIPALLLPILAYAFSFTIPSQYLSQTLVLIDQQKVPGDYVTPIVSSDLDSRLASMREQIFSRSRIQPIIERYNLYGNQKMSMDDRLEMARKSVSIQPIHSVIAHSGGLPGFFISFTANDPRTAQAVCGEITSLFLSESAKANEDSAEGTTEFLRGQLADAKKSLDEQDAKLAAFQRQYVGKLPGEETSSVQMLTSLNTQLEAATQSLARMEQQKSYDESMLAQQTVTYQAASPSQPAGPPPPPAASQAQELEMQKLLAQEADLTAHYTADYPDVIAIRRNIADLRRKMAQGPTPVASIPGAAPARVVESPAVQQIRAQIRALDLGINDARREQGSIQNAVRVYQDRISSSPQVQEEYKQLTRDYSTAQTFYDRLLSESNNAKMATDLERRQEGEQFRVMDQPNLPDAPNYPKRPIFALGGLAAGLAFGLLFVGILEYRDTALRTERDVWAFTKLPTLAIIALTSEETSIPGTPKLRGFLPWKTAAK